MEQITGRIVENAKIRKTNGGKELVAFTLVTNRRYKKKDGTPAKVSTFFNCAYWRSTAIAAYIKQGMIVTVFGSIAINSYKKQDGEFRANLVFHVSTVEFLTGTKESTETLESAAQPEEAAVNASSTNDDLPF